VDKIISCGKEATYAWRPLSAKDSLGSYELEAAEKANQIEGQVRYRRSQST
jgi:hypothetical protein